MTPANSLYPEITPFAHRHINRPSAGGGVSHQLYVEQCGNPNGIPVVFLHGGPGSGCRPLHRRYFDPEIYHIILFDQRGCGRSRPLGELTNNTSEDLIGDMEAIRTLLKIDRWVLFGGSWGATLAMLYARRYPQQVMAMILRGVFLGRQQDIDWVYAEGGASKLFPEAWDQLVSHLSPDEQRAPLMPLFRQLTSDDNRQQADAFNRIHTWESTIVTLRDHHYQPSPDTTQAITNESVAPAVIQFHYSLNRCFIDHQPILADITPLRQIPTRIIHGRFDMVCPVQQAWELSQHWPEAKLTIVPLAGHNAGEPALVDALIGATQDIAGDITTRDSATVTSS